MSARYDEYLKEHKDNVSKAFDWLREETPEVFPDSNTLHACEHLCHYEHDSSKELLDEYDAYDEYFYGNRSFAVVQNFNKAWLLHIHRNPHHWQHWVLINDDPDKGEILVDMPDENIIEMICDWWSFSWKQEKLDEIFTWYDDHKDHMKLSDYTRLRVEYILDVIKTRLADKTYDASKYE